MQVKKAFGRHEVWIDATCLHLGKKGVSFKVKSDDSILGTLCVTDTHVTWKTKGKKNSKGLTWRKFVEHMTECREEVAQ